MIILNYSLIITTTVIRNSQICDCTTIDPSEEVYHSFLAWSDFWPSLDSAYLKPIVWQISFFRERPLSWLQT